MPAVEELTVGAGPVYPGRDRYGNKVSRRCRLRAVGVFGARARHSVTFSSEFAIRSHAQCRGGRQPAQQRATSQGCCLLWLRRVLPVDRDATELLGTRIRRAAGPALPDRDAERRRPECSDCTDPRRANPSFPSTRRPTTSASSPSLLRRTRSPSTSRPAVRPRRASSARDARPSRRASRTGSDSRGTSSVSARCPAGAGVRARGATETEATGYPGHSKHTMFLPGELARALPGPWTGNGPARTRLGRLRRLRSAAGLLLSFGMSVRPQRALCLLPQLPTVERANPQAR